MLGTFGDFNEKFNYYEEEEGEGEEGEEGEESLFCSNNSSATTSARGSACSALLHPDEGASVFKRIEIENEEEGGNEWNEQIEEETSEKNDRCHLQNLLKNDKESNDKQILLKNTNICTETDQDNEEDEEEQDEEGGGSVRSAKVCEG
uniref:Candidate secreted effector n=1 Tax=Meloidogyne incognita TaxID=6306 RepID=A0A914NUH5_MELIC